MKQECPTYLRTIRKSKALATTSSNTELEDDFDNKDDGILNAFTATVNPTKGIVEDVNEEEDLVEKHEKLYRLATKKLNEMEIEREEISTKFDEAN